MHTSPKRIIALLLVIVGVTLIVASPAIIFSDAAIPFFRRVGLAGVGWVTPVDAPCYEFVQVRHTRAFAIFIGAGVLSVFGGTHLFVTLRRSHEWNAS